MNAPEPVPFQPKRRVLDTRAPLGVARALLAAQFRYGEVTTLRRWRGDFLHWRDGAWSPVEDSDVRCLVYKFLEPAETGDGKPIRPNSRIASDVIDALRSAAHLSSDTEPPAWLGPEAITVDPRDLLPVANGILDLNTGNLIPPTPEFFTLGALPVAYDPQAPTPTAWHGFLNDLWPDDAGARGTLQEFMGCALTADTRQQKIALIVGPKRSGKGTIARVLKGLLGTSNVAAPTLASLATNFGLAPLIGRRLATITDARLGARADQATIAERLLSISGEDALTIDRKHREAWTGRLDTRFLILTNELPKLGDASGALASRFIVLTLAHSFYGKEDHGLDDRLRGELPGILNWALEGLVRLRSRGHFEQPESSADALRDLEDLGSPVSAFIHEHCTIVPGAETECAYLFQCWREWCGRQNRTYPGTAQSFARDLKAAVPGITTGARRKGNTRYRVYVGIGL